MHRHVCRTEKLHGMVGGADYERLARLFSADGRRLIKGLATNIMPVVNMRVSCCNKDLALTVLSFCQSTRPNSRCPGR